MRTHLVTFSARTIERRDEISDLNIQALGNGEPGRQGAPRFTGFELHETAASDAGSLGKLLQCEASFAPLARQEKAKLFEVGSTRFSSVRHVSQLSETGPMSQRGDTLYRAYIRSKKY